jgi:hypothetical protein
MGTVISAIRMASQEQGGTSLAGTSLGRRRRAKERGRHRPDCSSTDPEGDTGHYRPPQLEGETRMKKKESTLKFKLNRETLQALEQASLTVVHGGAVSGLYTCRPCSGHATDLC